MNRIWISVGAIGFLLAAGWAGQSDYEDAVLAERAYCERVTLYYATAGEQGWPDYNANYEEICIKNSKS